MGFFFFSELNVPHRKFSAESGAVRVRRPFKYLKHQGPRPVPGTSPFKTTYGHQPVNRTSASREVQVDGPSSRTHEKPYCHPTVSRNNEKPYSHAPSRLLKSRNLNLSALDISACKLKRPPVELMFDEPECMTQSPSKTSGRLTSRTSQRLSCFSDWSTSASSSQQRPYSMTTSNQTVTSLLSSSLESFRILGSNESRRVMQRSKSYHDPQLSNLNLDTHLLQTPASVCDENQSLDEIGLDRGRLTYSSRDREPWIAPEDSDSPMLMMSSTQAHLGRSQ